MNKRVRLVEKYRPHKVSDFVGIPKVKSVLSKFVKNPYPQAFLFIGGPGVGKTSIAQAMAEEMSAEIHQLGSRQCNFDALEKLCDVECHYTPVFRAATGAKWNGMHLVLIDEVDEITETAQYLFLSKLDSTQAPPNTAFVFTCNSARKLTSRFVSRCIQLDFSTYGMSKEIVEFLAKVWHAEISNGYMPDLERIVKDCQSNVRDCLQTLETELLVQAA